MDLRNPNRVNSGPDGTFVDRNTTPGAERPGTVIDALTFNQMLAEFENLIKGAGLTPSSTDLSQLAKINGEMLTERIIDLAHPVGSLYTQYPTKNGEFLSEEEPSSLFKDTIWDLVSYTDKDGNGVFFRTEGGLSGEGRADGVQKDAYQGHWHGDGNVSASSIGSKQTRGWITPVNPDWSEKLKDNYRNSITDMKNGEPRISSETRGLNYNLRIWQRKPNMKI